MYKKVCLVFVLLLSLTIVFNGCSNQTTDDSSGRGASKINEIRNKDDKETKKTEREKSKKEENDNKEENNNDESNNTGSIENFLFIGDSMMNMLKPVIQEDTASAKVQSAGGKEATYFLNRLDSLPENNVEGIVVWIGVNGIINDNNVENTTELLSKLASKYPGKQIYVMKVFPVGKKWRYGDSTPKEFNSKIDEFNNEIKSYAEANNMIFIDATDGFVDENGYLIGSPDDLHIYDTKDNEKILKVIKSSIGNEKVIR